MDLDNTKFLGSIGISFLKDLLKQVLKMQTLGATHIVWLLFSLSACSMEKSFTFIKKLNQIETDA